jgi:ABC-type branched-subunit amino acid transport system substrate-binding protein/predicted negative regulator of RcsB-dependent stress response
VVVNGQEMEYEQAAAQAFRRAQNAYDAKQWDAAARGFAETAAKYPDSAYADEAMLQRARALDKAGKPEEAQAAYSELLEKHPGSRFKKEAALELSQLQAQAGKKQEAAKSMQTAVEQMSDAEKQKNAEQIAQALAGAGQSGEALRFAARALESAQNDAERQARMADYLSVVAASPGGDLARLVADLDRKSPAWPPAALQLARIQLHAGDRGHAQDLARDVLGQVSSGPVALGAQAIQLAQPQPARPNLIGIALPLTGEYKAFSDQVLNAVALAVDLQNKGPVQVEVKDTKGDADGAALAVEELARDGAIAILGPIALAEGSAAAVRAQQLGIPIVSLSRAEGLTQIGEFVFRDMLTNSATAKALADYAQRKLNARSFGILQPDSAYGDEVVRYFWDALDGSGSEVRAFEHYPQRTTTFKPYVSRLVGRSPEELAERKEYSDEAQKIKQEIQDPYKQRKALAQLRGQAAPIADFDALFVPDGARTVRLIAPAIAAEDVITSGCDQKELEVVRKTTKREDLRTVQLLGTNLWDNPELVDERLGAARYVQCAVFADSFFAQSQRPATKKFVDDYDAAYHRQPSYLEAHAYDAAAILRRTIEEQRPQTREAMRDALASMKRPFPGATGDTRFGRDREAEKPLFWLWISRGNILEFDPDGPPPVPPAAPSAEPQRTGMR